MVVGCKPTERRRLGEHKFPNGENIHVDMYFDYSDPDIAFGGDLSVYFDVSGDVEYIGRVIEKPSKFELDKIASADGFCVCFFTKNTFDKQILVVVDSFNDECCVSFPLKSGVVKSEWGKRIVEKVEFMESGLRHKGTMQNKGT